jgi:hypothetical protein
VDWINLAQDLVADSCLHGDETSGCMQGREFG